jgi:hypothetical protein
MNTNLANTVSGLVAQANGTPHGRDFGQLAAWVQDTNVAYLITSDNYTDVKRIPVSVVDLPTLRTHIDTMHATIAGGEKEALQKNGTLRSYKVIVCSVHMLAIYMAGNHGWIAMHVNQTLSQMATAVMTYARAHAPADLGRDASKLWSASCDATNLRVRNILIAILQLCPNAAPPVAAVGGLPAAAGGGG